MAKAIIYADSASVLDPNLSLIKSPSPPECGPVSLANCLGVAG